VLTHQITASLLMEQVLAPNFKFKTRRFDDEEENEPGTLKIRGFKEPCSQRVKDIVEYDGIQQEIIAN